MRHERPQPLIICKLPHIDFFVPSLSKDPINVDAELVKLDRMGACSKVTSLLVDEFLVWPLGSRESNVRVLSFEPLPLAVNLSVVTSVRDAIVLLGFS